MAAWDGQTLESQGPQVVAMFGGDAGRWEDEHNAALRAQGWTGPGQPPGSQPPQPPPVPSAPPPPGPTTSLPSGGSGAVANAGGTGSTGSTGSGGEVSIAGTQVQLQAAAQAANQAYLNAKLAQDSDQVAINKAVAEANRVYQEKSIELQQQQLEENKRGRLASGAQSIAALAAQRQSAFNTGMGQFEQTGVATQGRIAGLNALRQPLPPTMYAAMLGLDQNDPRASAIAQAAATIGGASAPPASTMAGVI